MSEALVAGKLQRVQGKGIFVPSTRIHAESTEVMGGLKQTLARQGVALRTLVMSFAEAPADKDMAARLSIPGGCCRVADRPGSLRSTTATPSAKWPWSHGSSPLIWTPASTRRTRASTRCWLGVGLQRNQRGTDADRPACYAH